ncbi:cobaltochelatase subunit CobN [Streptantibioticus silvisoli]|uniref:Cobaltochelatase subunit CobN n=1 Tax=Streptantibioticus silvisoli TaxID=2705255 RepID=A0ABT6W7B6_9ACTN|nr:cobaltochelatase subunit CobN [Streptantibioticus silvisoli]MDI5966628.1 cobaltochelatase subunit CobN [Streptantibioticus silvisoli]
MILLLSTSDTDLLAARAATGPVPFRCANPARLDPAELPALLDGAEVAVVRLLGGEATWPEGLRAVRASGVPTVVLGGESAPDAELMALSTVPAGVAGTALGYLAEGGPGNLAQLAAFLSDTVTRTGHGFEAAVPMPTTGVRGGGTPPAPNGRPRVGIVYYRAHELSGNTAFVDDLAAAVENAGGQPVPVFCGSLRGLDTLQAPLLRLLAGCDALVVTVLAAGGTVPADASAGGAEEAWSIGALADLDVPILQGICLTTGRDEWAAADSISPMDAAMQVAIPEFDGRIIAVPFSFKQLGDDGLPVYVTDPERTARLAATAYAHARLRHVEPQDVRLGIVLSSYPTKHARVGNAVGLDTPASAVRLLAALAAAGVDIGGPAPDDGTALIHRLIAAGGHDTEWLTDAQLASAPARLSLADYRREFDALPADLRERMREHWGEPPGTLYVDGDDIVLAGLLLGNVALMIQPPRGFGENPIAIYHDPDLPPSHHYLAAYRWLAGHFGADAVVHLGKHGTLEWLPGKGLGNSASCAPDAVLGDLPLVYPFIVNDPGEGTQAKRRAHAVVVDHLIPPMARADTYGELAKLEQLLDEYATVAVLDPDKLPTVRAQIWELVEAAQLHHDLHADGMPDEDSFDDFVLHLDGYLCEIKDVQIRDGLHILGDAPAGEARVNLVLSILRAQQIFGGAVAVPGLRTALAALFGADETALLAAPGEPAPPCPGLTSLAEGPSTTASDVVDLLEQLARRLVTAMDERDWADGAADEVSAEILARPAPDVTAVLRFAAAEVVPRLAATTDELTRTVGALRGRFVPPGPSGSPTRGVVSVLPTGRNFYSVDPKAIPSRNAWSVGVALADSLIARHLADTGEYPASVGLTVWGTSAMRTQGDDIAEVLALLGCRPVWDDRSRRVTGFEIVPLDELGRPRIDVTVRISGFFRDAFSHVIDLIDDAVTAVAALQEPADRNHLRRHVEADLAEHGDRRRATLRVFGSKPGAYGAGLLPLIDARNWHTDADLAEVFAVWGGYAYGRGVAGTAARADMERSFARIAVAAKNADTREHDIVDSDDYFQYHGGMVAMVRHLTGRSPAAYVGDSAVPSAVRTRTLAEETQRVFRSRVVNPKWINAMRRHGYKGAFELAATVDYLFGYDATAGVVQDWMYEKLASAYVFDEPVRDFLREANPWALRGITERLLEAADRGLWAEPEPDTLDRLRAAYLEGEDDLEGRA